MLKRILGGVLAGVLCLVPAWAAAQDGKPIKVALIASKTGPFEIYARDTERGLRLGLEYLTQGTMTVIGRKIELIVKDDQFKPELSKAMLAEAYNDDKVDVAIGTSWSGGTLSMLPASEEYKKVLLVEPAIADSITGSNWNRYVFRASRNGFQDALATVGLLKDGDNVAFLAADYSYGKEGVASFKEAMGLRKIKAKVVAEEYVPQTATDFTAPMQRIFDAMKPVTGKKYVVVIWGTPNPIRKLSEMKPERFGIEFMSIGGGSLENLRGWKGIDVYGGTFYYYGFPKNAMNDWLVAENQKRFKQPPDLFTAGGFVAASALIAGIKKANSVDTDKLVAALENLEFDTPKGKIQLRKEDHQGLQTQYAFKVKKNPANEWDILELVREVPATEMPVPVRTRH